MTTTYAMSYILEEQGNLQNSEFTDIYNRLSFRIRCTLNSTDRTAYMIYDGHALAGRGGTTIPLVCLDFGVNHALGAIKLGQQEYVEMDKYLARTSRNNSLSRKFVAADGNTYVWAQKPNAQGDMEWECVNASRPGCHIASYIPKSGNSSNGAFIVEENYRTLATEFLATLTIMRFVQKYNL